MTNLKAGKILLAMHNTNQLSLPMMKGVRKALAYSCQLMGKTTPKQKNWKEVGRVWEVIDASKHPNYMHNAATSTLPTMIPTPGQLKKAFSRKWNPETNKLTFVQHVLGRRMAYDLSGLGNRSNEDIDRLKKSRTHEICREQGWMYTQYEGGRAKLAGEKKGGRGWRCCGNASRTTPAMPYRWARPNT